MTVTSERFSSEKHYAEISSWWTAQEWPAIPLTHLPATGFVVSVEGVMACAGWLYRTDSAFCWFEFIVANPQVRREKRFAALSKLIEEAKQAAKEMGFQDIFMSLGNQSLIQRLKDQGFVECDKGQSQLMFKIHGGSNG